MPVELFYREKGRRENPPLILLHGLWGASDNWLPVAETLSGRFRVILPDLRNHGQSPRHPEHTYAIAGEDVEALIHRLALSSPPFMAGHSMGGKCLMYLLLKTPGIARKAAVIDISPKTYDTPGEGLHRKLLDFFSRFTFIPGEKRTALHQRIRREIGDEQTCQIVFKNLQRDTSGFHWQPPYGRT